MYHVAHNLKISTIQHFVAIYDIQAIFCTQYIGVFITINLTNFIFLDIISAVNIKYYCYWHRSWRHHTVNIIGQFATTKQILMYSMWHSIIIIIIIIINLYSRIQQYILKVTNCTSALNIYHTPSNTTSKFNVVESIHTCWTFFTPYCIRWSGFAAFFASILQTARLKINTFLYIVCNLYFCFVNKLQLKLFFLNFSNNSARYYHKHTYVSQFNQISILCTKFINSPQH
jgi:hypothetical protein